MDCEKKVRTTDFKVINMMDCEKKVRTADFKVINMMNYEKRNHRKSKKSYKNQWFRQFLLSLYINGELQCSKAVNIKK